MLKIVKLLVSIFIGLDVFVAAYYGLANLRVAVFGQGAIPGGGSAVDMAIFLLPVLIGYIAGDRLFYFLNYKERKAKWLANKQEQEKAKENNRVKATGIWEDSGWDDSATSGGLEQKPDPVSRS
ncbi:MAG: hypothetical protein HXX08_01605 [Chloroflexi bacterium]|uniref:Uncharacterized protein n=1 Tax=Candidatus Chlorohelix allophototropha TaxID=3003348 RepID=A0A8T7LWH0_9CHLR|nr:hypothetical protein [Chloroflexota bacterium]WJW66443.1 hypothetical protein OZ401_002241 [Chloroflexota bacterium L227-S17]